MKKSIPVSDELNDYFTNPCPVLSDNNSLMILDEIAKGYDWVVEYGLGASTLYFLKEAQKHEGGMISVENNFDWFQICIQEITKQTGFIETHYTHKPWTLNELSAFLNGQSDVDVPEEMKRLSNWKDSLSTGPFFRFSPKAKSRFSNTLGPLWPALKPIFKILASALYLASPDRLPHHGEWIGKKEKLSLILRNVGPSIKDQFGEAPNMMDYINAGLKDIRQELSEGKEVSALFVIDGGPRHKIVQEILKLEEVHKSFRPTIILCDASRAFYHATLQQRQDGMFIGGTNSTLKGDTVTPDTSGPHADFWTGGHKKAEELARQEVWYYSKNTA